MRGERERERRWKRVEKEGRRGRDRMVHVQQDVNNALFCTGRYAPLALECPPQTRGESGASLL